MFSSESKRTRHAVNEGAYFFEPANRICEHLLAFVLAELSMLDFMFLMFSRNSSRPGYFKGNRLIGDSKQGN